MGRRGGEDAADLPRVLAKHVLGHVLSTLLEERHLGRHAEERKGSLLLYLFQPKLVTWKVPILKHQPLPGKVPGKVPRKVPGRCQLVRLLGYLQEWLRYVVPFHQCFLEMRSQGRACGQGAEESELGTTMRTVRGIILLSALLYMVYPRSAIRFSIKRVRPLALHTRSKGQWHRECTPYNRCSERQQVRYNKLLYPCILVGRNSRS